MLEPSATKRITIGGMPTPVKALATCIIVTLAFGMAGALGQIYVHDIVPTFFGKGEKVPHSEMQMGNKDTSAMPATGRGDLFSDLKVQASEPKKVPLLKNEQFVWTLKWTHIHLFGMNMIFILMGAVTLMLNISKRSRTWLVVLPFVGVMVDILAMWLKGFVSPVFFWLHVPGGCIFGAVFFYVALRALWEMWGQRQSEPSTI